MARISFQVTLENVELKDSQKNKLEKEINALVATYLVKAVPPDAPLGSKQLKVKRPAWQGIWIRKFKTVEELKADPEFRKYTIKVPQ